MKRMLHTALLCLALLLVWASTSDTSLAEERPASDPLTRPLRVLTANILNYSEPYRVRMKLLRAQIAAIDPDLIGFQEAGWTPGQEHQVQQLLQGMQYFIDHEAGGLDVSERRLLDVAVASRCTLQRKALRELHGSGKALAVEVDAPQPAGRLLFISTFGTDRWQFDRELSRERDAVALDDLVREISEPGGFPPIIAGDFDATPDAASIRFLAGRQSLAGRSTHWYDAWEVAGNGGSGFTWTTKNDYARKTTERIWRLSDHERRIDYIFLGSPHQYRGYARVVSARVVLDTPEGADWPSDHFGVLAEIAVQPSD